MTTQFSFRKLFKTLLLPFLTYLCLFVGMGYVAGSIVHFGEVSQIPRFAVIGTIGMVMYAIGSYVQEAFLNPDNLRREGLVRYILYSLILAVGIGMLSGGTQHFLDFPIYASYLLPSGFLIALVGYVLRNNVNLTSKGWLLLLGGALTLTLPFFLGLHLYAQNLPSSGGHSHGSVSPSPLPQEVIAPAASPHGHSQVLKTDADFLKAMIPHHQEAVDTSAYMLTRTENPDLRKFGREVIAVQAGEIDQMKAWHQDWFSQTYQDAGTYLPMMGALDGLQGTQMDRAYLQGMIEHHQGAITMAKQIQTFTQRPELKRLATAIISTQSQEVEQLRGWLQIISLQESPTSPAKSDPGHPHPDGNADHAH